MPPGHYTTGVLGFNLENSYYEFGLLDLIISCYPKVSQYFTDVPYFLPREYKGIVI